MFPLFVLYQLVLTALMSWRAQKIYLIAFLPSCLAIDCAIWLIAKKASKLYTLIPLLCLLPYISQIIALKTYDTELTNTVIVEGWLHFLCTLAFVSRHQSKLIQGAECLIVFVLACFPVGQAILEPAGLLVFCFAVALFILYLLQSEIAYRQSQLSLQKNKANMKKYQQLVDELIPQGLVVLTQNLGRIEFINGVLRARFSDDESVLLRKFQETLTSEPACILPTIKSSATIQSFDDRDDVKLWHIRFSTECGNHTYEVRRVTITWEQQPAYLVILSEISGSFLAMPSTHEAAMVKQKDEDAIASVSHEIRAPTNSIMSALEVASSKTNEPETRGFIKIAKNSANFLLSIVNSFLDMGQISNDKLALNFADVNVFELLEEIREMIGFQTDSKGLDFIVECQEEMPSYVNTDGNRLKQILVNLLSNAIKFTKAGSITLGVNWDESAPEILEFYVKDTGIGIKEADKAKLFKAYSRLEGGESRELNKNGVGLGLLISMKLAALLGPENTEGIMIKSVYGKGSTFSFQAIDQNSVKGSAGKNLPSSSEVVGIELRGRKVLEHEIKHHSQKKVRLLSKELSPLRKNRMNLSNKTVLIVEDNPFNLLAIKSILLDLRVQIIEAYNGEEAIKTFQDSFAAGERIDLVFMDCYMPVMDGFETASRLKESMAKNMLPAIPIIGLTADIRDSSKSRCFESGMDDVIVKPASKDTIFKVISNWCK